MAHSFQCKRCGHYEASHLYPEYDTCDAYESPDRKAEKIMWDIVRGAYDEREAMKRRGPAYEH